MDIDGWNNLPQLQLRTTFWVNWFLAKSRSSKNAIKFHSNMQLLFLGWRDSCVCCEGRESRNSLCYHFTGAKTTFLNILWRHNCSTRRIYLRFWVLIVKYFLDSREKITTQSKIFDCQKKNRAYQTIRDPNIAANRHQVPTMTVIVQMVPNKNTLNCDTIKPLSRRKDDFSVHIILSIINCI